MKKLYAKSYVIKDLAKFDLSERASSDFVIRQIMNVSERPGFIVVISVLIL